MLLTKKFSSTRVKSGHELKETLDSKTICRWLCDVDWTGSSKSYRGLSVINCFKRLD